MKKYCYRANIFFYSVTQNGKNLCRTISNIRFKTATQSFLSHYAITIFYSVIEKYLKDTGNIKNIYICLVFYNKIGANTLVSFIPFL